jgi:hypothetical protein
LKEIGSAGWKDKLFHFVRRDASAPALVTLLGLMILVFVILANNQFNPVAFARLGTRFQNLDPDGTIGYDGQFVYDITRDLNPTRVAQYLDVPAYRYQGILLPLLAHLLSLGKTALVPWAILLLGVLSQALGTFFVSKLLKHWGANPWYALIYGLWIGLLLSVGLDLPEPLAFMLVAAGIFAGEKGHKKIGWILLGLSLFAKEVTITFIVAMGLSLFFNKKGRDLIRFGLITLLPYALFQLWLWRTFGSFGLGSGGEGATPFEIIPFMGVWKIGEINFKIFVGMILFLIPVAILPSFWGIWAALKKFLGKDYSMAGFGLLTVGVLFPFIPLATIIDMKALLRFLCGLVLALILFAGKYKYTKVLWYSSFWLVLNIYLFRDIWP